MSQRSVFKANVLNVLEETRSDEKVKKKFRIFQLCPSEITARIKDYIAMMLGISIVQSAFTIPMNIECDTGSIYFLSEPRIYTC